MTRNDHGDATAQGGVENVALRNELADLLDQAATVEHDVLCQYLFAAATFKQSPDEGGVTWAQLELMRGWKSTLMQVARQEMEHLGIVTNLLSAVGEAPRLDRPDFPVSARVLGIDQKSILLPFSRKTLLRFVCFEMPARLSATNRAFLETQIPGFTPGGYDGIFRLYSKVEALLGEIEPTDLLIGPASAQFVSGGNSVAARGITLPKDAAAPQNIYDIDLPAVTDVPSAIAAVRQIVDEGEGSSDDDGSSHFARFLMMYRELVAELERDPDFEPARDVVSDPRTGTGEFGTIITNPSTARISELFDLGYGVMIQMLMRLFAHTDETDAEIAGLESVAFFPLMTTVIRPLSEILTQLPAFEEAADPMAGPSFAFPRRLAMLPHREAAWRNIDLQLALLEARSAEAVAAGDSYPPALVPRLQMLFENVARIRFNFQRAMALEVSP